MLRYRADIEGLRALAIVPIVLFHAGVAWLPGGYAGVDVFFVISGFLLTRIITEETGEGRFSFARFYQRRMARLLPALFVVLGAVMVAAPLVQLVPDEIAASLRSAAAAAGFVANFHFLLGAGYFARSAEAQHLLHTWSLGVEEQFYIVLPLLLVALARVAPRWQAPALAVLAACSLGGGLAIHAEQPLRDFYLLPFRAWELLLGGLVALGVFPAAGKRASTVLATGGTGLVLAGMARLQAWSPFPSPLALVPAGGAALVIAYGEATAIGRVLATAPLRWIGRLSYSLYLWHWPLIVFWRQWTGDELSPAETAGLVLAALAAAAASHRLIERPARRWLQAMPAGRCLALGLGGVLAFAAAGLGGAELARRLVPMPAELARLHAYRAGLVGDAARAQSDRCFVDRPSQRLAADCLAPLAGARNVLLLGDSHAHMYGAVLRRRHAGVHWLEATRFGCAPLPRGAPDAGCTAMTGQVLGELAASGRIAGVVLASRWRTEQAAALAATVRALAARGITVTVIGPVPEFHSPTPMLRALARGDAGAIDRFQVRDRAATDRVIEQAARGAGATYVSAYRVLCPGGRCRLHAADGAPLRFDYGHLTDAGAALVIAAMPAP